MNRIWRSGVCKKVIKDKRSVTNTLALVNLSNNRKKVKHHSLGMKQRLPLALALLRQPKLLIPDEPVNGLEPTEIVALKELLIKLNKEEKMTIIISSHILGELHKLATCYGYFPPEMPLYNSPILLFPEFIWEAVRKWLPNPLKLLPPIHKKPIHHFHFFFLF